MESYELSLSIMRSKIFWVWYTLMVLVNLFGSFAALILQGPGLLSYTCFFLEGIMLIMIFEAFNPERTVFLTTLLMILIVGIEFPLLYLVYREIIIAYFILSIFAIVIFCTKKIAKIMLGISVFMDVLVICLADKINLPNKVPDSKDLIIFNAFTFIVNAAAVGIIVFEILFYYEKRKHQLNSLNDQLRYSSTHDPLTKLNNRSFIINTLVEKMNSYQTDKQQFYVAILDIDDFKKINDTLGHTAGDDVLKILAETMNKHLAGKGIAGRYGGEEFLVIMNVAAEQEARALLNMIKDELGEVTKEKYKKSVSFSAGLNSNQNFKNADGLISGIDSQLYDAKKAGKNQII